MDQNDKSSEIVTANKQRHSGWAQSLKRFVFICLYVVFLAAVVFGVLAALEYYAYLRVKASPVGQAYKGRDMDLARQSSQKVAPQYGYEPTPGFATIRNTRLGNSYEYINDESFKDFEDVPLEKPPNEFRVFVCGGSVVFGRGPVPPADSVCDFYEVTFRWNIPHLMEQIFNSDPAIREKVNGKRIRVINAGVSGYVYQNNFMRYLAKLRLFQPDLLVSLDGANEVHTVARPLKDWNYFTEGPYYEVITEVMDMSRRGFMNYLTLWLKRNTYFFTWLAFSGGEGPGILMENRGFAAHPQDATPEMIAYRDRNIRQVADVVAMYHETLKTDGVPHVLALQPMFRNSKKKRTPIEERIEAVTGMEKIGFYNAAQTYDVLVDQVKKRCGEIGFEVVDLTGIFDSVSDWVFTDWCHLTNGGNYIIAKELVNQVKQKVFHLSLAHDDILRNPLDSYFTDYAKNARVLINGQPEDKGLQILKGYPGPEFVDILPTGQSSSFPVVLDLGAVVPVSRLRIVWGDEQSVPQQWRVEISEDGSHWKTWYTVDKAVTDKYDQWPGFEYYAPQQLPARYVGYVPVGEASAKPVKLRQFSLFR
ncbi:MAG TPA: discoidin domain-containing protein [Desulfomonilaceae bacterium]|nr:discoidin domain-containing protein [Desulfomonilaceae bacterium]